LKLEGQISVSIDQEKIGIDQVRISKTDLRIRPIFHSLKKRIEAHICVSFMAYLKYKELERALQQLSDGFNEHCN